MLLLPQDMRTPLAITLAANGINLGLDVLLILGLGWGVAGAATATTAAEWVAAAAYLGLLWRRREALGGLDLRDALGGGSVAEGLQELVPFLAAGGGVWSREQQPAWAGVCVSSHGGWEQQPPVADLQHKASGGSSSSSSKQQHEPE